VILAGDVGATKILLEVGESRTGRWETAFARRYATEGAVSFAAILESFLDEWRVEAGGRRIGCAGFGVAGPVTGNRAKMTNRPWVIDADAITVRHRIPKVRVANDLVASALGIEWVPARQCVTIQPGRGSDADPRVVLGVGTGLGIAYLVPVDGKLTAVPGEGGHAGFAPATHAQMELWRSIYQAVGRVSCESILSGPGLAAIYSFLHGQGAHPGAEPALLPERITEAALTRKDALCCATLDLFAECLGTVAGDHALAAMARGGVYLVGGITAKIATQLQQDRFRAAFCAKAPHSALLMKIPVRAITSERVGVLGAARLAIVGSG
jgi:glucokinase